MKDMVIDKITLRKTKADAENPKKKTHWYVTVNHGDQVTQVQLHGRDDVQKIVDFVKSCTDLEEDQRGWEEVTFPATDTYREFTLTQSKARYRLDLNVYAKLGDENSRPAVVAVLESISARTHISGDVDLDLGNVTKRKSTDKRA